MTARGAGLKKRKPMRSSESSFTACYFYCKNAMEARFSDVTRLKILARSLAVACSPTMRVVRPAYQSVESWIDSYFESLAKVKTETGKSEALALKRSNFPKALYRYRSLERLAYRLEELRDSYVFLSRPTDFNDPYDSALSVSWEQVQKQVLEEFGIEYGYDPKIQSKFFESLEEREKEYEQQAFEDLIGGLLSVSYLI
jgi:hypothetical protein